VSIRPSLTLCGALAALFLGASAWLAAPGAGAAWIEPVSISQLDAGAREPQIAVDASGDTTAVWTNGAIGSRSIRSAFRPAEPGTLKAKLTGKARKAIDAATKPVPVVLTVTGSAAGSESATLSRTLRIKRP
jgi:hypothetical protein